MRLTRALSINHRAGSESNWGDISRTPAIGCMVASEHALGFGRPRLASRVLGWRGRQFPASLIVLLAALSSVSTPRGVELFDGSLGVGLGFALCRVAVGDVSRTLPASRIIQR